MNGPIETPQEAARRLSASVIGRSGSVYSCRASGLYPSDEMEDTDDGGPEEKV